MNKYISLNGFWCLARGQHCGSPAQVTWPGRTGGDSTSPYEADTRQFPLGEEGREGEEEFLMTTVMANGGGGIWFVFLFLVSLVSGEYTPICASLCLVSFVCVLHICEF